VANSLNALSRLREGKRRALALPDATQQQQQQQQQQSRKAANEEKADAAVVERFMDRCVVNKQSQKQEQKQSPSLPVWGMHATTRTNPNPTHHTHTHTYTHTQESCLASGFVHFRSRDLSSFLNSLLRLGFRQVRRPPWTDSHSLSLSPLCASLTSVHHLTHHTKPNPTHTTSRPPASCRPCASRFMP